MRRESNRQAAEGQLHKLEAARRLLVQVHAVHAISWSWSCDALALPGVEEVKNKTGPTSSTLLTAMPPVLRRRSERPRMFLAALFLRLVQMGR